MIFAQHGLPQARIGEHPDIFFHRIGEPMIADDAAVVHPHDALRALRDPPVMCYHNDGGTLTLVELRQ